MLFPVRSFLSGLWIALHLLLLSAQDIREGRVSVILIAELGASGLVRSMYIGNSVEWMPGLLLLCLGYISGERIGYGDGWLILALGAWLPLGRLLTLLKVGALFCVLFAIGMGRKELPFVPFLTAAYLMGKFI